MTRSDLIEALAHPNVGAFLALIREGETNQSDDAYRMMFGGELFDAPPWQHPHKAVTVGGITSTAAGAPQFLSRTWDALVAQYGFEDFSPAMQDLGAVALIAGRKALDAVKEGRIREALRLCAREWASLPGSPYGQPTLTLERALAIFPQYGGTLADESTAAPPAQPQEVKPMGILAAVLPALMQAAPDIIRLLGGQTQITERNAAVVQKIADAAVQVTGAVNEQAAAAAIQANPELAQAFRDSVTENFDQWLGMMVKFAEIDEASKAKTRDFVSTYDRAPVLFRFTFVELLSLSMVAASVFGGAFVLWDPMDKFTTEMQTAVVMLMLIGGWNGVKEFWLGSSMGSRNKDAAAATK